MTYHVYLDNFRGFSDTSIPIIDVNFLVGENSTGKTSILALLKILAGPSLFFGHGFHDEDVGFSGFSDIVSQHAEDRSYFRIGFCKEGAETKGRDQKVTVTACLCTFENNRGIPHLTRFTFSRGTNKISFRLKNGHISYRRDSIPETSATELASVMRQDWVGEHRDRDGTYEKLPLPPFIRRGIPMIVALAFALDEKTGKSNKDKFSFEPPDIDFLPDLIWLAPIRAKPKRTYDQIMQETFSPEGTHTPYLIRRMRSSKQAAHFNEFIEKVGVDSGLFEKVVVKSFGKNAVDAPFELDVSLDGKLLNLTNVGYGVSQALPVLTEIFVRRNGAWFVIQQPEVHLHPRAQAALGDAFFKLASTDSKCFLIETHSDFTIDRFRLNYQNENSGHIPKSQILFFERKNSLNTVTSIEVKSNGDLSEQQPESYREFFVREQMNLLSI